MTNEMKLQSAIKRKTVLRETLHNTTEHKVKECKVTRVEQRWYGFEIEGDYFECTWESGYSTIPTRIYFRNNAKLEKTLFGDKYGVTAQTVMYASSLHFGCGGLNIIKTLWLVGEVLNKKNSSDFFTDSFIGN